MPLWLARLIPERIGLWLAGRQLAAILRAHGAEYLGERLRANGWHWSADAHVETWICPHGCCRFTIETREIEARP